MGPDFKLYLKRQELADKTQKQILSRADKILAQCKPFSKSTVDQYLVEVADQYSNATVNKYVQAVKKICDYKKLDWGKTVTRIKEQAPRRETMSDDEIERLISLDTAHERYKVFWHLVAYTGARPGEILSVSTRDFDLSAHTLTVKDNKSNDYRTIPIAHIIRSVVYPYINNKEDRLFNVSYRSILKDFNERCKQIGIKRNVTPYSLRHSFITRMVGEADLFDVQSIVGHKKASTTQIYVHKNLKTKRKAIKKDPLSRSQLDPKEILEQIKQDIQSELDSYELNLNDKIEYEISGDKGSFKLSISVEDEK